MKAKITMKKKPIKFEVIPHEQAVKQRRENESRLAKLKSTQLPQAELKEARRVLERAPITNKMYHRLQKQRKQGKQDKQDQ